ncbi:MAG TPA: response regulator transcription factor [Gemmatimonadaceae bacterium]|nr:response regulator transcription factor [Gemmatimonadaceae bacterium]
MVALPNNPARILVVEDDRDLLSVLRRMLEREGYTVESALNGLSGLDLALDHQPDVVILDVGLPFRSGVDVARDLRSRGFRAPVLMLTAHNTLSDRVTGLDAGADDYLPKPFEYPELVARVRALLRRSSNALDSLVLHVGDLTLDPIERRVEYDGKEIPLSRKGYAVLECLVQNAGRIVSRQTILERVWKEPVNPASNIVDVYINYLRKKLDEHAHGRFIDTVRGSGYVFRTTKRRGGRQL